MEKNGKKREISGKKSKKNGKSCNFHCENPANVSLSWRGPMFKIDVCCHQFTA